jgi:hypothetical protein
VFLVKGASREKRNGDHALYPRPNEYPCLVRDPERYYQRNKELVEACTFLHAFMSQEDGFTGGTRFEVEYAVRLGIPVQVHWEGGVSYPLYQYPLPFIEGKRELFLAWEDFFHTTNLEVKGG